MSRTPPISKTEGDRPDSTETTENNQQSDSKAALTSLTSQGADEEGSGEEWEAFGYEETEEGKKARHMFYGFSQAKRKKKRLFSYHWNVRKY